MITVRSAPRVHRRLRSRTLHVGKGAPVSVTDVRKDPEALTMTVTSEWDASVDRVWQLWADPRRLERWWGPPTYPATVIDHDLRAGGKVSYFMTSPEGEKYHGTWKIVAVDQPHRIDFEDSFADDQGNVNSSMPTTRAPR